jgi:uncharacterized repeat protein (TIGR03803 family)
LIPILIRALIVITLSVAAARCAKAGSTYKVLHHFGECQTDGCAPTAALFIDRHGALYGTTSRGGGTGCDGDGCGTVFKVSPHAHGRWGETILHSFAGGNGGATPIGGVVLDRGENAYGTTVDGGNGIGSPGIAFQLTPRPDGWVFTVLHNFNSWTGDAEGPTDSLILDRSGHLFGTARGGGTFGDGSVFELKRSSQGWTSEVFYSFCLQDDCADGDTPEASLTRDAAGNLYGTASKGGRDGPYCGGSLGCGVVFKLKPTHGGGWQERVLHRFAAFAGDGQYPFSGVVMDAAGNVYGTTFSGGVNGNGSVFMLSFSVAGWKETILHNFSKARNGTGPVGGLVFDKAGNLYGTASSGGPGSCGCGVVFKLSPKAGGKWQYSVLHSFRGPDGDGANAGLIMDGKAHLYGTTLFGGAHGNGVVFEIIP